METKICKQCGDIKPLEQFRQYYKGKGHYTICKSCESINTRAKYLNSKEHLSPAEADELKQLNELYELQRSLGLKPPTFKAHKWGSVTAQLPDLLEKYSVKYVETRELVKDLVDEGVVVPYDLARWLSEPLNKTPEYYETLFDGLVSTYRPVLYVSNETFKPVYKETYAKVLDKILERFNEYEDAYDYNKED